MASLTEQMEQLKKQQDALVEKIKEEEERKIKESYTIERLEQLNYNQSESIKKYKSKNGLYARQRQQTNLMTNPRFQIILEILKKQDARITQLENIIKSQLKSQLPIVASGLKKGITRRRKEENKIDVLLL